jgi:hypothetical protein
MDGDFRDSENHRHGSGVAMTWYETRAARERREVWGYRMQGALIGGLGVMAISGLLTLLFMSVS